ncbi:MAG: YkgJ family cysteine cluster protein [Terrimicrobiaceae bacterium]
MTEAPLSPAARLCAACGMCCNGVLFHSVLLQPGDSARALSALGLKMKRKKGVEFFLQPCPAHCGSRCTIYEDRPARCRHFQCRQLLRVAAGEISEGSALEKIQEAREAVARINLLISRVAETNPNRGLAQRCANALTTADRTPLHDELDSAMRGLEALLEKEFRIP